MRLRTMKQAFEKGVLSISLAVLAFAVSTSANGQTRLANPLTAPPAESLSRGIGSMGGGAEIERDFVSRALVELDYLEALQNKTLSVPQLVSDLRATLKRIKIRVVDTLIDPKTDAAVPFQEHLYAFGSPGLIQLKPVWETMLADKTPLTVDIIHELMRASGQYDDNGYKLTIQTLGLDRASIASCYFEIYKSAYEDTFCNHKRYPFDQAKFLRLLKATRMMKEVDNFPYGISYVYRKGTLEEVLGIEQDKYLFSFPPRTGSEPREANLSFTSGFLAAFASPTCANEAQLALHLKERLLKKYIDGAPAFMKFKEIPACRNVLMD